MGVGKTERLGKNDSRFGKGRRVDETNDRVISNLKIRGGKLQKVGDQWTLKVAPAAVDPGTGTGTCDCEIPDIVIDNTSAPSATLAFGGSFTVLNNLSAGGDNKHTLTATSKTLTLPAAPTPPTVTIPPITLAIDGPTTAGESQVVVSNVAVHATDKHKLVVTLVTLAASGGLPEGYKFEDYEVVTTAGIVKAKLIVATVPEFVFTPASGNKSRILQVVEPATEQFKIGVDHGRLADGA